MSTIGDDHVTRRGSTVGLEAGLKRAVSQRTTPNTRVRRLSAPIAAEVKKRA